MATDLGVIKAATGSKHEAFLDKQIERTRRRIRGVDIAFSALALGIVTLAYGLAMALLDRALDLPSFFRVAAFAAFAGYLAVFLVVKLILPLCRPVNPLFAARQLERTLPGAKNSVINWLDLRGEKLPPAILGAVGKRAANDVAKADLERAVSARNVVWMGGVVTLLLALMLGLLVSGPERFWSLMARAFFPFHELSIAADTTLVVIKPQGGNATVPVSQPVTIIVRADGKALSPSRLQGSITLGVREDGAGKITGYENAPADFEPHAPMLHIRYAETGAWTLFPMEQDQSYWQATVPENRVLNGFFYRVTGGDAQTDIYHIQVEATPLVKQIEVTYHYPKFLRMSDRTSDQPNLEAVRGTEVELVVRTNRPVGVGGLEMEIADEKKTLKGEVLPDDAEAFRCKLPMTLSGTYRAHFSAKTGEAYTGPVPYTIDVIPVSEVTYKYRSYLGWKPQTFLVANLPSPTALRGTEVTINYFASRPVKDGRLEMQFGTEKTIRAGKTDLKHPELLQFTYVLDRDGKYGLASTSVTGEAARDPRSYTIRVLPDNPPGVELTKPGKDIELPANEILKLEGQATDDFGLKSLVLRMSVVQGIDVIPLDPKPYRAGKTLRTGAGAFPILLKYTDFVELEKVTRGAKRFELKPDMILEYWLEATDNCDYPKKNENGQTAESKHYKVTIQKPQPRDEKKKQEQKQQAENEKKKHEDKQDEQLGKQKEQKKQPDADPNQQNEKKDQNNGAKEKLQKEMNKENPEKKKGGKGESKKGENQQPSKEHGEAKKSPESSKQDSPPKNKEKGSTKSEPKDKNGESKSGNEKQQKNGGEAKEGPKDNNKQDSAKSKTGGKEGTKPEQRASEKTGGDNKKSDPRSGEKNSAGQEKARPQDMNKAGTDKTGSKHEQQGKEGNAKNAGPKDQEGKPKPSGENKDKGKQKSQSGKESAAKSGQEKEKKAAANASKNQAANSKSEPKTQAGECCSKGGGKDGDAKKAQAKGEGNPPPQGSEDKKGAAKGERAPAAKSKEGPKQGDGKTGEPKEKEGPKNGAASGKEKGSEKGKSEGAGSAKGDKKENQQGDEGNTGEKKPGPKKEPTLDDVKKNQEKAKSQDPDTRKKAERDLAEQAHKAKDERVRQKAEEALKELGRDKLDPGKAKPKTDKKKKTGTNPMNPKDPKKEEGKEKTAGSKQSDQGKEKKGPNGKAEGDAKAGNKKDSKKPPDGKAKAMNPGPGSHAGNPNQEADPDDPDSAKKNALNLEKDFWNRLSRMSPAEREKFFNRANLTEQEKTRINDELNARTKTNKKPRPKPVRGSLPNQPVKEVKSADGKGTILSGKGVAPSGFAPVLEKFSRDLRSGTPPRK